ncbi:hypothetical protein L9F63_005710, partial [Diploptera punctata]
MAGREGLIDTAVKTSRSGYLQRCLVKHLEGVKVCYDSTVRDSDGSVLQFRYGEDGKDVTKAQFLKKKQLPFLADNSKAVLSVPVSEMNDSDTSALIAQRTKQIRKWKKKHGDPLQRERRLSAFTLTRRSKAVQMICDMWVNADSETLERYHEESQPCPDPVSADFVVGRDFGALTEQLEELMNEHMGNSPRRQKKEFHKLMSIKSLLSACHPGDPVGVLAAQSIGEPSTQMTLNTFHFAGRGEMNVTLGIPRLRELLMTASVNIKTPYMDVPLKCSVKKANKLKLQLCRVTVADVLQYINVNSRLKIDGTREHVYKLHLQFLPRYAYKSVFSVKPSDILKHVENVFFKSFFMHLHKIWKIKTKLLQLFIQREWELTDRLQKTTREGLEQEQPEKIRTDIGEDHESSDEEEENEDDDATLSRSKQRHKENQEYEEPEEEEMDQSSEDEESKDDLTLHEEEDNEEIAREISNKAEVSSDVRKKKVLELPFATDYKYDVDKELWCELTFCVPVKYEWLHLTAPFRQVASNSVVTEVPHIKRAVVTEQFSLRTEGINLQ